MSIQNAAWQPLGQPYPTTLADARVQLHHAVQLLASFAQVRAAPQEDDSHRSMTWDADAVAFRSAPSADDPELTVLLTPETFEVHVARADEHETLALTGKTLGEAYAWLGAAVGGTLERPEYEIPEHRVGSGAPFDPDMQALAELARWYGNAYGVLTEVTTAHPAASPIRCWPHHFDLATLISLPLADGERTARTVGAGMSPGDGSYPAPYGYVTPWPYLWEEPRPELSAGQWHLDQWLGAVLTAGGWTSEDDSAAAVVSGFYAEAVLAATKILQA